MKLIRPVLVTPGVHQVHAMAARITVLEAGDGIVLVDAGGRGSLGLVSAGLRTLGFSLDDVRWVVITHVHPDHVGGLPSLVQATGARVAAHRLEADAISGREPCPTPHHQPLVASLTRPLMRLLFEGPVPVDLRLEDDERLPFAPEVRTIHTPGHTPGSICLYVEPPRTLVVGDALRYAFGKLHPPSAAVTRDLGQALDSLQKLAKLELDAVCFSHYPPLRRNASEALGRLLRRIAAERRAGG